MLVALSLFHLVCYWNLWYTDIYIYVFSFFPINFKILQCQFLSLHRDWYSASQISIWKFPFPSIQKEITIVINGWCLYSLSSSGNKTEIYITVFIGISPLWIICLWLLPLHPSTPITQVAQPWKQTTQGAWPSAGSHESPCMGLLIFLKQITIRRSRQLYIFSNSI